MSFIRNMKSIKNKILVTTILLVGISLLVLGSISIWLNIRSTNDTMAQTMEEMAEVASARIAKELDYYKVIAQETGSIARLTNPSVSIKDKQEIIDQKVKAYNLVRANIVGKDGISILTGVDYNDRDYFKVAMQGKPVISDPLLSKTTNTLSVIVAAPLWKDGMPNTTVEGMILIVPQETFLNDVVKSFKVSPNTGAYMINKNGSTVAHTSAEMANSMNNTIENAKANPALNVIADLEKKMIAGEGGFGTYTYNGIDKFLAYAPIEGTDGWSIGINAPESDFMASTRQGILITIVVLAIAMLVAVVVGIQLAVGISKPIQAVSERFNVLASEGDLDSPIIEIRSRDEVRLLRDSGDTLLTGLKTIISDVDYMLGEMSNGNFDIKSRAEDKYIGGFSGLMESIRKINYQLSDTLTQINQSSEQVSSGSEQVSSGAQALSQGATEQASSVEELAATINDVSAQIRENSNNAQSARSRADLVAEEAVESNASMNEMRMAMNEISDGSREIGKIIKTIEDIAFQTNILALNAAVEAARAGSAGKGFAVVADEVRNLANKSAEASKNSAALIENSLKSVERGRTLADETAMSMEMVVQGIKEVTEVVDKIAIASAAQDNQIEQITVGMDQISSVVQTNSATAEESAAASEELSGQAQTLKGLVGRFSLRKI